MVDKKQTEKKVLGKKRKEVKVGASGKVYITATFNNTLVTITNSAGDVVSWSSSGAAGFKGTRKSTPFAATTAMENAARAAIEKGIKTVEVYVKGPGPGREASLRGIRSAGLSISMISDLTPIPHNGPRSKKRRRV
ncbi:MAG: 30S ribosomal protein S11 [Candidatus Levybacteria bacterium]|nr:30S ribosomal protein S11 [Candidatus Levybacteria bacterium]